MKKLKTNIKFFFEGILIIAFLGMVFLNCESKELQLDEAQSEANIQADGNKKDNINICHYDEDLNDWITIRVNENSWEAHSAHGDFWLDRDGDGYTAYNACGIGSMDDCDDLNPDQFPGAEFDQWWYLWEDLDEDGWSVLVDAYFGNCRAAGYLNLDETFAQKQWFDCDDTNPDVNPAAVEVCDDIDNNCDGLLFDPRHVNISFQGVDLNAGYATFGPAGTVTGPWVAINDVLCAPSADDFTGKIVLIDRGACFFEQKVAIAQSQGAIGVIIINNPGLDNVIIMNGPGTFGEITIPSIFLGYTDGEAIRNSSEPTLSFTVEEDWCLDTSANKASVSNTTFVSNQVPNTHTIDKETGEFVKSTYNQ